MCSPKKVRCFYCYQDFSKTESTERCPVCGDFKCPLCGACLCTITPGEQRVALAMIHTYENALNTNYDFSVHKKIESKIKIPTMKNL